MVNQEGIPNHILALFEGADDFLIDKLTRYYQDFGLYGEEAVRLAISTFGQNNVNAQPDRNYSKRDIMLNIVRDSFLNDRLKDFLTEIINSVQYQDIPDGIIERLADFDENELLDMHFIAFKAFMVTYNYGNGGESDQQIPKHTIREERRRRGFL
jgi:hypothetical protein